MINILFLEKPNIFLRAFAVQNARPSQGSTERVWQSLSNLCGEIARCFSEHAVFKPFFISLYFLNYDIRSSISCDF